MEAGIYNEFNQRVNCQGELGVLGFVELIFKACAGVFDEAAEAAKRAAVAAQALAGIVPSHAFT